MIQTINCQVQKKENSLKSGKMLKICTHIPKKIAYILS